MAIAFVQAKHNAAGTASLAVTISPTAGNQLVVGVSIRSATATVTGVTDNATGGSSTYVKQIQTFGNSQDGEIWTALSAKSGVTTVTIALSASSSVVGIVGEYSGVSSFGNTGNSTGTGANASVSVTLAQSGSWVAAMASLGNNQTVTAGTGNLRDQGQKTGSTADTGALVDNTSASPVTCSVTSAAVAWEMVGVEMKAAASFQPDEDFWNVFTPGLIDPNVSIWG